MFSDKICRNDQIGIGAACLLNWNIINYNNRKCDVVCVCSNNINNNNKNQTYIKPDKKKGGKRKQSTKRFTTKKQIKKEKGRKTTNFAQKRRNKN